MSKAKTHATTGMTPEQVAIGMMEIREIAQSIERLALMTAFGELEDERDQQAVSHCIRTLANVSGLISELIATNVKSSNVSWTVSRGADPIQWLLPPAFHQETPPTQSERGTDAEGLKRAAMLRKIDRAG